MKKFNYKIYSFAIIILIFTGMVQASDAAQYKNTRKLFALLGIKYTNNLVIGDEERVLMDTEESVYVKDQCIAFCLRDALQHGVQASLIKKMRDSIENDTIRKDLQVKYVNDHIGYGVFATKNIPADSFIGVYSGEVCLANLSNQDYSFPFYGIAKIEEDETSYEMIPTHCVDASKFGNITRFINHSDCNNCGTLSVLDANKIPQVVFYAKAPIKKGEQLTINYGSDYQWKK